MPTQPTPHPGATISRRGAERLHVGHTWVYQSDVLSIAPADSPAALIPVRDQAGHLLGTALFSPTSQISLRLVTRDHLAPEAWLPLFRQRLQASIARREALLLAGAQAASAAPGETGLTDSCRLVFSEADQLPGLIIDKYAGIAVFQLLVAALDTPDIRAAVVEELAAAFGSTLQTILERPDPRIRELESLSAPALGPLWCSTGPLDTAITASQFHLNGLRFLHDANAGQKTGAFLDQRLNYQLAAQHGHGEALDVCTYQGGFALHLATTCRAVTGLDTSAAALDVAEQNLALNRDTLGTIEVDWVKGDAFAVLREWADSGSAYDTIVLDPPAFAKTRRAAESAMRGYKELNLRAFKMLRPGGTLVTCSCSHHVPLADFQEVVAAAAADANRRPRLIARTGAAPDHPVILTLPETEYLKCLVLELD
jgi:23S rRNA (cytosine1962-C5)-methyltransferase